MAKGAKAEDAPAASAEVLSVPSTYLTTPLSDWCFVLTRARVHLLV